MDANFEILALPVEQFRREAGEDGGLVSDSVMDCHGRTETRREAEDRAEALRAQGYEVRVVRA